MRSLKRRIRANIDPAPSIISYRLMRLMLIPRLRLILTLGIPSIVIFCVTLVLFLNINVIHYGGVKVRGAGNYVSHWSQQM